MKRYLFLLILIVFSCNNTTELSEMETISTDDSSPIEFDFNKPNYSELNVIEEKLQETYDLVYFLEKNEDFESSAKISSIITQNIVLNSEQNPSTITIKDLKQLGNIEIINDSTSHINFTYKLKTNNIERTDSLKAIIKKKAITIEGLTVNSIKIDFTKHDF
ncbi:MAG: hypothetical protein AB8B52_06985 [Winogradskyella sp.]|uniref:hypothetical protein n=1 Tax=Winogradskyella sp. TaxID=1883156 RepID=UPI0038599173